MRMIERVLLTCLWKGVDLPGYSQDRYSVHDVHTLARNAASHLADDEFLIVYALTDEHYAEGIDLRFGRHQVRRLPFRGLGVGGWSNVMEAFTITPAPLFRPNPRHVLVGLDTIFVGPWSWLYDWDQAPIGLPLDPYHAPEVCDAVVTFDAEGSGIATQAFFESRKDGMRRDLYAGRPSEMALLRRLRRDHRWRPIEDAPKRLLSYKVHLRDQHRTLADVQAEGASVIYFHGDPKPCDLAVDDPISVERYRHRGAP